MKTFFTHLFILVVLCPAYSQFVNNTPLKNIVAEYIELSPEMRGGRIVVHIDFGQPDQMKSNKTTILKDENYEPYEFNSMIGALNFMSKFGYELEEFYTFSTESSARSFYILKRKRKKDKEL